MRGGEGGSGMGGTRGGVEGGREQGGRREGERVLNTIWYMTKLAGNTHSEVPLERCVQRFSLHRCCLISKHLLQTKRTH